MLELDRQFMKKLADMHVLVNVPDHETVVLLNVPAHPAFFNKHATNLLVKRPGEGLPFFAFVDHDLRYTGESPTVSGVFASAESREGWRVLRLAPLPSNDLQGIVEHALAVLGSDGREPSPAVPTHRQRPGRGVLATLGVDLSGRVRDDDFEPTAGRTGEIDDVTACVSRWGQKRLALVAGPSGVGKSNLLAGVARRLLRRRPERRLVAVDLAALMQGAWLESEREARLAGLLDEAADAPEVLLALEHVERTQSCPQGPLLVAEFLDRRGALIGTTLPNDLPLFETEPLARRVHRVTLEPLSPAETVAVLSALRERIARHHAVEIDESCIPTTVRLAGALAGEFPAKAIALLDAAASLSSLAGTAVLGADDISNALRTASSGEQGETA